MDKRILTEEDIKLQNREHSLFERVSSIIEVSRKNVVTAVNTAMVYTYYDVGRYIVEDEQDGEVRAEYGKTVLKKLSVRLTQRYGAGWSYANLKNIKQFYLLYSKKLDSVYPIHSKKAKHCLANPETHITSKELFRNEVSIHPFTLSWSHYLVLMRIKNDAERSFYEIECKRQDWSVRQLQLKDNP